MMAKVERDQVREDRIDNEIIVDAYSPEEQAMGWYHYLDEKLTFPFRARCIQKKRISPLRVGEEVKVIEMAPEDDCIKEMFVEIHWLDRAFGVPLAQLEAIDIDDQSQQGIDDWHYWVAREYTL
ncbi:MAG: calcium-binding protein [Ardenticatenaceae bacterium]